MGHPMNSSEEEKSDEYLVVDSSNPWVLGWVYLRLEVEQEKECVWDITPAGQFGYHNSFWRPPNHAPLFFFHVIPIDTWFKSYYSM